MSRLRANQITNENANGAPNFPHGLTVTGIVTASTSNSTLNQIVVGSAVTANSQGIDVTGIVTATSFSGAVNEITIADESSDTTCFPTFVTAATGNLPLKSGSNLTFNSSTGALGATIVSDSKGDVRSIVKNSQTSAYVAVASDAGKAIFISSGGVTINNSVFSAGDALTIINNSGSNQTITQGSGMTMYNAASGSSGNRTLAGRGMATLYFAAPQQSYISGAGLS